MQVLGYKDSDLLRNVGEVDAPVHGVLLGDRREDGAETGLVATRGVGHEFDAHKKEAEGSVLVLIGIEDVDVVTLHKEVGDRGDKAFAVRAVDQKDSGLGHGSMLALDPLCAEMRGISPEKKVGLCA